MAALNFFANRCTYTLLFHTPLLSCARFLLLSRARTSAFFHSQTTCSRPLLWIFSRARILSLSFLTSRTVFHSWTLHQTRIDTNYSTLALALFCVRTPVPSYSSLSADFLLAPPCARHKAQRALSLALQHVAACCSVLQCVEVCGNWTRSDSRFFVRFAVD